MTLLLNTSDIALMTATVNQSLPTTATLSRSTQSRDAAGGITNTWATVGTYACSISPYLGRKGADEVTLDDRFQAAQYWRVVLPAGTTVTLKDRLGIAGRAFEVKGVGSGVSAWEVMVETFCVEVT